MTLLALLPIAVGSLADFVFGWLLYLPRDVAVVLVAVLTVGFMTFVRRRVTNQDLLRRCAADLRVLKQRARTARQDGDRDARQRIQRTTGMLKLIQLRADLLVLIWAIVPLGWLAWWAMERFEYLPVRHGEEVTLEAHYSLVSVGHWTHLVPPEGGELLTPAIQRVTIDPRDSTRGVATWKIRATAAVPRDLPLVVRHQGESATHPFLVGGTRYAPPEQTHASNSRLRTTWVPLREYRFLGVVPGWPAIGLPAWLVAYFALTMSLMPIAKRLLGVA